MFILYTLLLFTSIFYTLLTSYDTIFLFLYINLQQSLATTKLVILIITLIEASRDLKPNACILHMNTQSRQLDLLSTKS